MEAQLTITMQSLLEELDFEPFAHPFGARGAYRICCGPYTFEAARLVNKWCQESYFLRGHVNTGRTMSLVDAELPLTIATREEGLALLGYFIGQHLPEHHKPPWLRIAERLSAHLPWSRKESPTRIFPNISRSP